jgi:hypothetical protein
MPRNPEMDELERWLAERKKIWEANLKVTYGEVGTRVALQIDVIALVQHQINAIRKKSDLAAKEKAENDLKDI